MRLAALAGLLLIFVVSSAHAQRVKDSVKDVFKVSEGGTLYIDMDHGNIEIESTSDDMVYVEVIRAIDVEGRREAEEILDEQHQLTIEARGNDVSVESRYEKGDWNWKRWGHGKNGIKVTVMVRIPDRYNVDFSTGAGNIDIGNVRGAVDGKTGAGNIEIGAVEGPIDISSGAGNIDVAGALGRLEVSTGAGNIELSDVRGSVRAVSGAGNVTAKIRRQPEGDSRLESGAGNVTVYLSDDIGVYVEAVASMGSARTDFPLRVEGKWMRKSFEGRINDGGPDLYMRAGVGNVSLRKQ